MAGRATLDVRHAVARSLIDIEPGQLVLVACSGGADSLALAAAAMWVGRREGLRVGSVTIDHGLQDDSAAHAQRVAAACAALGLSPALARTVEVVGEGGLEMAARRARYIALDDAAHELGAVAVLLGHTREDQAETVLLALARGSGARSLSGMRRRDGLFRRPLLALPRDTVREAAQEAGDPWDDPHNSDPRFTRVRAREMLAEIERAIGPGVVAGLARSAELLRADADALDAIADERFAELVSTDARSTAASAAALADLVPAVRTRVIRRMCLHAGAPATDLDMAHVVAVERLVTEWSGQGPANLPGGVVAARAYGRLSIASTNRAGSGSAS